MTFTYYYVCVDEPNWRTTHEHKFPTRALAEDAFGTLCTKYGCTNMYSDEKSKWADRDDINTPEVRLDRIDIELEDRFDDETL